MIHRTSWCVVAILFAGFTLSPHNAIADTASPLLAEAGVRTFFKDIPVMIEIARCESKFRQNNPDGSVLRGGWGGGMVGVFQVFGNVHKNAAAALGFDIETLEGNLAYAKYLYTQSGTTPWNSSKACWGSAVQTVSKKVTKDTDIKALEARIKVLTKLVGELQQLLEKKKVVTLR